MDQPSDGYVRVPRSELHSIEMRHASSAIDLSIALPEYVLSATKGRSVTTGYAEWVGAWHGQALSMGWDWGVVDDAIILLEPQEIRTNVLLLADDRQPIPSWASRLHLLAWVESWPWREAGIVRLLRH